MPATAASSLPPSGSDASPSVMNPTPSGTTRTGLAARVAGYWPTGLVMALLTGWALWLSVIMTHPLHPTSASALLDSVHGVGVERWAFVEPNDDHFNPLPFLTDPMRDEWQIADQAPAVTPASSGTPASQNGWVAWKDYRGTHVAPLTGSSVTVTSNADDAWTTHTDTKDGWLSAEVTLPRNAQVHDVGGLWNGNRLLGPSWLVPFISFVLAVALLYREPRHRTRWGWFWLLGAPLGLGFLWMLLREQVFVSASNREQRPGGWTGLITAFLLGIPAQILLSGIVPRM